MRDGSENVVPDHRNKPFATGLVCVLRSAESIMKLVGESGSYGNGLVKDSLNRESYGREGQER